MGVQLTDAPATTRQDDPEPCTLATVLADHAAYPHRSGTVLCRCDESFDSVDAHAVHQAGAVTAAVILNPGMVGLERTWAVLDPTTGAVVYDAKGAGDALTKSRYGHGTYSAASRLVGRWASVN